MSVVPDRRGWVIRMKHDVVVGYCCGLHSRNLFFGGGSAPARLDDNPPPPSVVCSKPPPQLYNRCSSISPLPRSLARLPLSTQSFDKRVALTLTQVMFREHRESSSTSFRELPGSMLGTALHVYRRASGAPGGAGALPARDAGGGGVGGGLGALRGRGGASLGGRGGGGGKGHKEAPPQSFALLTSMGIYHGSLALGSQVNEASKNTTGGAGRGLRAAMS